LHIGELTYTYDANGNQTGWESDVSGQRRKLMWDEENRLRGVYDNGALYHYLYDASGERVLKGQSTGQRIFVNGEWKAGSGQMGNYTVYVNPYLVLNSGGYTKHYYVEAQRIVSKLGGGWDNNGQGPLKAGDGKVDYAGKNQKVFDGIVKNLKFLGADGQILTAGKSGKIPPGQVKGSGNVTEAFRYFYHPDHVGSTSYVTDASGEVFQHLEYTAWGETLVDDHSNTNRTPYLFNGKELDDETGLYYYGARYYDPRTSIWQSVDPLVDRYPSIAGYTYSGNNPLTYTDPDGKKIKGVKFVNGEYVFSKAAIKNGTDKYIMARIQTETGRSKINAMIADKRTYTIGVTDKTLVLPSGNAGKYALAAGVTDAASGILYISTDKTKLENLTSDQLKNGLVTINNAGDLVPISLNKNQLEKPLEDPNGKYQQDYNRAYEDSGAKEFDSKPENQFENVEQLIHGSGAHEETHLTNEQNIEYSNNDDTYNTEKQAFEVEIQERKEYIKTKSKSDN
jgi:RHS repeat-associated protein